MCSQPVHFPGIRQGWSRPRDTLPSSELEADSSLSSNGSFTEVPTPTGIPAYPPLPLNEGDRYDKYLSNKLSSLSLVVKKQQREPTTKHGLERHTRTHIAAC